MQQVLLSWIFLKKTDLANLKSDVDKLDIDNVPANISNLKGNKLNDKKFDKKLNAPVDLSKLSDVVKTDVVKKRCI